LTMYDKASTKVLNLSTQTNVIAAAAAKVVEFNDYSTLQ